MLPICLGNSVSLYISLSLYHIFFYTLHRSFSFALYGLELLENNLTYVRKRKKKKSMSSMSMSSTSTQAYPPDHISSPSSSSSSDQLCYVHCSLCDTVLAVSVPPSSLFKTVTVRCGHCSNLLSVTVSMRALLLPSASNLGHSFFPPPPHPNLLEEMRNTNMMMSHHQATDHLANHSLALATPHNGRVEMPRPPPANRPPEKRQRVPSAYNRFIKEEIQRIKAGNPDISHREAFSAAAKNWAHFPHIHFGLMPDYPPAKKANVRQQMVKEGEEVMTGREGFYEPAAN